MHKPSLCFEFKRIIFHNDIGLSVRFYKVKITVGMNKFYNS